MREFGSVKRLFFAPAVWISTAYVGDTNLLLRAARWTVLLSAIAFAGGMSMGLVVALLRTAPGRALRWTTAAFIDLYRTIWAVLREEVIKSQQGAPRGRT